MVKVMLVAMALSVFAAGDGDWLHDVAESLARRTHAAATLSLRKERS